MEMDNKSNNSDNNKVIQVRRTIMITKIVVATATMVKT